MRRQNCRGISRSNNAPLSSISFSRWLLTARILVSSRRERGGLNLPDVDRIVASNLLDFLRTLTNSGHPPRPPKPESVFCRSRLQGRSLWRSLASPPHNGCCLLPCVQPPRLARLCRQKASPSRQRTPCARIGQEDVAQDFFEQQVNPRIRPLILAVVEKVLGFRGVRIEVIGQLPAQSIRVSDRQSSRRSPLR